MTHFYDLVEGDAENRKFCEKNGVPYFVTAEEREEALKRSEVLS